MIAYRHYLVVVPHFKIDERLGGKTGALLNKLKSSDIQSDDYIIGIAVENATEVRNCFETLMEAGFTYSDRLGMSEDFAVVAKEGMWWDVAWLVRNDEGCWFIADVEAPV